MQSSHRQGGVHQTERQQGNSVLHSAVYSNSKWIVELLLDHGAEVEAADPRGKTALMLAAGAKRNVALSALLERGAKWDKTCDAGFIALHHAWLSENAEGAHILLQFMSSKINGRFSFRVEEFFEACRVDDIREI